MRLHQSPHSARIPLRGFDKDKAVCGQGPHCRSLTNREMFTGSRASCRPGVGEERCQDTGPETVCALLL